jgi:hypothetical protein
VVFFHNDPCILPDFIPYGAFTQILQAVEKGMQEKWTATSHNARNGRDRGDESAITEFDQSTRPWKVQKLEQIASTFDALDGNYTPVNEICESVRALIAKWQNEMKDNQACLNPSESHCIGVSDETATRDLMEPPRRFQRTSRK